MNFQDTFQFYKNGTSSCLNNEVAIFNWQQMNDVFILERISKSLKNPQIQTDFQFCSKLNSSTSTRWKYSTANPDGKTIIHFVKDPKTKTRKDSQKMRKQVPNEHFQNFQFHNLGPFIRKWSRIETGSKVGLIRWSHINTNFFHQYTRHQRWYKIRFGISFLVIWVSWLMRLQGNFWHFEKSPSDQVTFSAYFELICNKVNLNSD